MPADVLDTITKLINSPPGQVAAGAALAGIVWKFFERVEAVLTDQTKFEIAVWLVGMKAGQKMEPVARTFINMFDRVFGAKHLSLRCFTRSSIASLVALLLTYGIFWAINRVAAEGVLQYFRIDWQIIVIGLVIGNIIPDYVSLLVTRYLLGFFRPPRSAWIGLASIVVLVGIVWVIALLGMMTVEALSVAYLRRNAHVNDIEEIVALAETNYWRIVFQSLKAARWLWFYPAFFSCIWFALYTGSGFLLNATHRFDLGFAWFNRHFDIEKKPLQSIGLVAGAIVAVVYWSVVAVHHFVG